MTTPTTNWMMRLLLLALAVVLLLAVPAALGSEVGMTTQLSTTADVDAQVASAGAPPGPTAAPALDADADANVQVDGATDLPVSVDPLAMVGETTVDVPIAEPDLETAAEGGAGILPVARTEAATAGAVAVAAVGSAGAFFWLKNALGLTLGRFVGAPLFSRLAKDELLENEGRESLFHLVTANPGIGLQELAAQSGLGWGTTVYHLGRLEQGGFITSMKHGQARHFFKNGHPAAQSKKAIAVLKNPTASEVARFLLATPGATQKTISDGLGIAPPTVTKYVKRLEAEGLVATLKEGRSKIVQTTDALVEAMHHVDAPMPTVGAESPTVPTEALGAYA